MKSFPMWLSTLAFVGTAFAQDPAQKIAAIESPQSPNRQVRIR